MGSISCLYTFLNLRGSEITLEQVKQCRDLYSSSYGLWSSLGPRPGKQITATLKFFREQFLFDPHICGVVIAKDSEENLIGQAFYVKYLYSERQKALWITQLVVRQDHRNKRVASGMIHKVWTESDPWACGLVSANPYAVKALEAATKRRCNLGLIAQHSINLIQRSCIPYVQNCDFEFSHVKFAIRTKFYVEHDAVDRIRVSLPDWQLGSLDEGEEYFAFTFTEPSLPF